MILEIKREREKGNYQLSISYCLCTACKFASIYLSIGKGKKEIKKCEEEKLDRSAMRKEGKNENVEKRKKEIEDDLWISLLGLYSKQHSFKAWCLVRE